MKKILIFSAFIFLTLNSCKKEKEDNIFMGPKVQMGSGMARSWITISHAGVPQEIGLEMTNEVLSGLPKTNFSVVVPLHSKAQETTPFNHLQITWAGNGHPLPGSFIGPHFDVRFFMMTLADRLAIPAPPAPGFDNLPPDGYMPASYFPDAPVPQLGVHWTNKTFPNPVTQALILGSYNGKFTFVSPVMILPVLESGQSFSVPYAQPQYFAKHNWYPTKYNIYEKDANHKHYVTLSDFVWR